MIFVLGKCFKNFYDHVLLYNCLQIGLFKLKILLFNELFIVFNDFSDLSFEFFKLFPELVKPLKYSRYSERPWT